MKDMKEYEDFFKTDEFKKMTFWQRVKIRIYFAIFGTISQF